MKLDPLIDEIAAATEVEDKFLIGMKVVTNLSRDLLSEKARQEIGAPIIWATERRRLLIEVETALKKLRDHLYPNRYIFLISEESLKELNDLIAVIRTIRGEFDLPPVASFTVSAEIPVENE